MDILLPVAGLSLSLFQYCEKSARKFSQATLHVLVHHVCCRHINQLFVGQYSATLVPCMSNLMFCALHNHFHKFSHTESRTSQVIHTSACVFVHDQGSMWLNWVVLTGWNAGCLPLALLIGASRSKKRVLAKAKSGLNRQQAGTGGSSSGVGQGSDEQEGFEDLGDVALMGV